MNTPASPAGRGPCAVAADGCCDFVARSALPDMSGHAGPQTLARCRHCGLGITLPSMPDVSPLYATRESQDFQPAMGRVERTIKAWFFRRQARALLKQLPELPERMLDFGCGSGLFTRCLGDVLSPQRVAGADFHDAAPPEMADRDYFAMANLGNVAGSFDAVLASHVLEHDDDATDLLARIVVPVRPGGLVVIEVPNIDCIWARVFGAKWDAWYAPYHRSHFSRAALLALVRDGGLTVVSVHGACVPTIGRTLANIAGCRNTLLFILAGAVLHPLQWLGEMLAGTPSAMRVIARRAATKPL